MLLNLVAVWVLGGSPVLSQKAALLGEAWAGEGSDDDPLEEAYDRGKDQLDEDRLDEAIAAFDEVIRAKGSRADAALYWKATALDRKGRHAESLAALAELPRLYPKSRWVKEANALEVEIKSGKGGVAESNGDVEFRLLALNSLMQSDPERALPVLEKLLSTPQTRIRERVLFVLTQNTSPKALALVEKLAKDGDDPDMQTKAIRSLALLDMPQTHDILEQVYHSSTNDGVKKSILQAYMISGDHERLLGVAKGEPAPALRRVAIQQLGVMGAQKELWELYQALGDVPSKKAIIEALFISGNVERVNTLAQSEKDPDLREAAVRSLGLMGATDALGSLYEKEKDSRIRQQIIEALFIAGDAKALVKIGRAEKDPELRKKVVSRLGLMGSKDATDFLLEILNGK